MRARKESGSEWCTACESFHLPNASECRAQAGAEFVDAPLVPSPAPTHARELLPQLLAGAQLGADALVHGLRTGAIRGRDLAVATGVLIDKALKLEAQRSDDDEPMTPEQLQRELAENDRISAELARRGLK